MTNNTNTESGTKVKGTLIMTGAGILESVQYPKDTTLRAYCTSINGFGDPKNSTCLVNGVEVAQDYKLQADDEIAISPRNSKNA